MAEPSLNHVFLGLPLLAVAGSHSTKGSHHYLMGWGSFDHMPTRTRILSRHTALRLLRFCVDDRLSIAFSLVSLSVKSSVAIKETY